MVTREKTAHKMNSIATSAMGNSGQSTADGWLDQVTGVLGLKTGTAGQGVRIVAGQENDLAPVRLQWRAHPRR